MPGKLLPLVIAIGRSFCAFTIPIEDATVANMSCTFPVTRSAMASGPPLYGTCTIFVFVMIWNSSPAR